MKKIKIITIVKILLMCIIGLAVSPLNLKASQLELQEETQKFLKYLDKGEYSVADEQFDKTMRNVLPAEKLKKVWENIVANNGPLKSLGDSRVFEQAGYQIVLQTCNFEKGQLDAKTVFNKKGQISGLWFLPTTPKTYTPPSYVNEDTFVEKEVKFGAKGWELPGTLSLPKGKGHFPAVVLVHGSGPQDRDESIGLNKPFKDIAWGLATNGIAVLRYDKRTKVHGQKIDPKKITVEEEVIEDALMALNFLRKTEKVNAKEVFLLGHSLGGMLATEIASRDKEIAGVIILGGNTRPVDELLLSQTEYISLLDGKIDKAEEEKLEKIRQGIKAIKEHQLAEEEIFFFASGKYWYDLRSRDPIKTALELFQPMLILHGQRDYQVSMKDFEGWKKGLVSKKNVSFKLYPYLNHLFMSGKGKSTPSEYERFGHVDEKVIKDIVDWISKN